MMGPNAYRGQPLVVLGLLVGGWIALRAVMWEPGVPAVGAPIAAPQSGDAAVPMFAELGREAREGRGEAGARVAAPERMTPAARSFASAPAFAPPPAAALHRALPPPLPAAPALPFPGSAPTRVAAGHQIMWMAALKQLSFPKSWAVPALASLQAQAPNAAPLFSAAPLRPAEASPSPRRWSADAWLMLRRGGDVVAAGGPAPASYGASQAGAVLRYRLDPASPQRPSAYLRATGALNGSHEREAAVGVSARISPQVPIVAAAEARLTSVPGATRIRPAAFAYTELAPVALPAGTRAEAYLQGGYVGGGFATAFIDGQLRWDVMAARVGPAELRTGLGVWGGAQRGASRLDVGPTATVSTSAAGAAARLALDWRFRVSGNAVPASGPAITLSAGF